MIPYSQIFKDLLTEHIKNFIIMKKNKVSKIFINITKFICIITCLYLFICSLDVLSTSFKLLAGKATGTKTKAYLENRISGYSKAKSPLNVEVNYKKIRHMKIKLEV